MPSSSVKLWTKLTACQVFAIFDFNWKYAAPKIFQSFLLFDCTWANLSLLWKLLSLFDRVCFRSLWWNGQKVLGCLWSIETLSQFSWSQKISSWNSKSCKSFPSRRKPNGWVSLSKTKVPRKSFSTSRVPIRLANQIWASKCSFLELALPFFGM